jgi:hypothetical protein
MELLKQGSGRQYLAPPTVPHDPERPARSSLRSQIARLEQELSEAFVAACRLGGPSPLALAGAHREARMLDLGELERVRDELVERLGAARATIAQRAEEQAANRLRLERMLLEPGKYRSARMSRHDIGEPGCGDWQVRPRLGLIGMLMGWWQVKLSSGCPLP